MIQRSVARAFVRTMSTTTSAIGKTVASYVPLPDPIPTIAQVDALLQPFHLATCYVPASSNNLTAAVIRAVNRKHVNGAFKSDKIKIEALSIPSNTIHMQLGYDGDIYSCDAYERHTTFTGKNFDAQSNLRMYNAITDDGVINMFYCTTFGELTYPTNTDMQQRWYVSETINLRYSPYTNWMYYIVKKTPLPPSESKMYDVTPIHVCRTEVMSLNHEDIQAVNMSCPDPLFHHLYSMFDKL